MLKLIKMGKDWRIPWKRRIGQNTDYGFSVRIHGNVAREEKDSGRDLGCPGS